MKNLLLRIVSLSLLSAVGQASVIHVPGGQPTIQAGIDAAARGDTVLVAAGVYFENINFRNKNIVVASHFILNDDIDFISTTIIDGSRPSHPDTGSCAIIGPGHDSTTVLAGFTLTGGTGTRWQDIHDFRFYREGGGILVDLSSPIITNNIIVANEAINSSGCASAGGGGIRCGDSNPLIENNLIENNKGLYGAGMVLFHCQGVVRKNIIAENSGGRDYGGAGIWIYGTDSPLILNNTIVNNTASGSGTGNSGVGGGIYVMSGRARVTNNIVWNNAQAGGSQIAPTTLSTVTYNLVQGGYSGRGNLEADPLFADSTWALSEQSPCIDAGDPHSRLDADGTRADIGAQVFFHLTAPYIWLNKFRIDDSAGNNNGIPDDGESVHIIVEIVNSSLAATGAMVHLVSDDATVRISQPDFPIGDLGVNQKSTNDQAPFIIDLDLNMARHLTYFYLNISADGGYANRDSFTVVIGTPEILLLDDDIGATYENFYITPLNQLGIYPEHRDISVSGIPDSDDLLGYKAVIYFTGDDRETTLTPSEQSLIAAFLEGGGRLLLSGQNIGYDLVADGTPDDSLFFENYLHAHYQLDSSKSQMTIGVAGDPIADKLFVYFQPSAGAGNQSAPDVVQPVAPAAAILKYLPAMSCAALRYDDATHGSRLIYFAFGIEGISGPKAETAATLLQKSLDWLMAGQTVIHPETEGTPAPDSYRLEQNFPNPFNAGTVIRYQLAESGFVDLIIYNIYGQRVGTLVSQVQKTGQHRIRWNAGALPSGIYFYEIKTSAFSEVRKCILLK